MSGRGGPAQEHGLLGADHSADCEGRRGVTLSYVCPHCHRCPLEDCIWRNSTQHGKKQSNWWCAACGGKLVFQDSTDRRGAKVFQGPRSAEWCVRKPRVRTSCAGAG